MICAAIDIGNTRMKAGVYESGNLVEKRVFSGESMDDIFLWLTNQKVQSVICTATRPLRTEWLEELKKRHFVLLLDHLTPLPIENGYDSPQTLGKDRLAAVVGANALYPKQPNLVIDAGTCTTYDLVDAAGVFRGGNISPGLRMRFQAMQHFTARLPLVERPAGLRNGLGTTTETAMQLGGGFGNVLEMRGWIQWFRRRYPGINIILTGGDADYFAKRLKTKIFVSPNLVLFGLYKILLHNVE